MSINNFGRTHEKPGDRARDCGTDAMSFIPFNAIAGGLSPVNRSSNEQLAARKVQGQKNSHHHEEVDELDDAGVSSVHDQQPREGRGKNPDKRKQNGEELEEKVEIAALSEVPAAVTRKPAKPVRGLDISA